MTRPVGYCGGVNGTRNCAWVSWMVAVEVAHLLHSVLGRSVLLVLQRYRPVADGGIIGGKQLSELHADDVVT